MLCPHKQLLKCLSQNHFGAPKVRILFLGLHTFVKVKVCSHALTSSPGRRSLKKLCLPSYSQYIPVFNKRHTVFLFLRRVSGNRRNIRMKFLPSAVFQEQRRLCPLERGQAKQQEREVGRPLLSETHILGSNQNGFLYLLSPKWGMVRGWEGRRPLSTISVYQMMGCQDRHRTL